MTNGRGIRSLSGVAIAAFLSFMPAESYADGNFTGKTIEFIVPFSAGGTTDTIARILATSLEDQLGATVQVVNKPGAASQVGLTELINSKPDGLTIAYGVLPTLLTHYLDPDRAAPYGRESFTPIAMHYNVPNVLAVKSDSPYQTVTDVIDAAKEAPGTVTISDSGLMGAPHLLVLMLQEAADAQFASVHFQGGAPATTALLGGHVSVMANAISDVAPYVRAGDFRILGVADDKPSEVFPEVPTMASEGFNVVAVSSTALLGPAGMPAELVEELSAAVKKTSESEEHAARLRDLGISISYEAPEQLVETWIEYEERVGAALRSAKE